MEPASIVAAANVVLSSLEYGLKIADTIRTWSHVKALWIQVIIDLKSSLKLSTKSINLLQKLTTNDSNILGKLREYEKFDLILEFCRSKLKIQELEYKINAEEKSLKAYLKILTGTQEDAIDNILSQIESDANKWKRIKQKILPKLHSLSLHAIRISMISSLLLFEIGSLNGFNSIGNMSTFSVPHLGLDPSHQDLSMPEQSETEASSNQGSNNPDEVTNEDTMNMLTTLYTRVNQASIRDDDLLDSL